MDYFRIKNWDKFQHYTKRTPPWIKLHRDLLNDYEFSCLQDASKLHLMLIWLLASQMDNQIPLDPGWVQKRLCLCVEPNLKELIDKGFIEGDSKALANCMQSATPEVETEAKEEAKEEAKKQKGRKSKTFKPPSLDEVKAYISTRPTKIDPQEFIDHYTANGWFRGKTKIKDWKACVRTWESNRKKDNGTHKQNGRKNAADRAEEFHEQLKSYASGEMGGSTVLKDAGEVRTQVDEQLPTRRIIEHST